MASGASAGKLTSGQKLALERGRLCQLLHSPDYNLFPNSAVFESDFVQITKQGEPVEVGTVLTVGVTSSDPCLPLPNVLVMAKCPVDGRRETGNQPLIDLVRLLPLRYIQLSVYRATQHILRLRTVTRKVYYLKLHRDHPKVVFELWHRLADILKRGLSITSKDPAIHIRHSLVPSDSSSSETLSATDSNSQHEVGPKVSGIISQCSEKSPRRTGSAHTSPESVSFQQVPASGDVPAALLSIQGPPQDVPLFPACAQCGKPLPRGSEKSRQQE